MTLSTNQDRVRKYRAKLIKSGRRSIQVTLKVETLQAIEQKIRTDLLSRSEAFEQVMGDWVASNGKI